MKKVFVLSAIVLATSSAFAQTTADAVGSTGQTQAANSAANANSLSGATAGAQAVGGGLASSNLSSVIGGNRNNNASRASGGAGGNSAAAGGAANVTVNLGSDPSGTGAGTTANAQQPVANAQTAGNPPQQINENIKTVGNPGAMSFATSFSQYNCANTAGAGAGFLGGAFNFGGPIESGPCNARANAGALVSLAQVLPADDPMRHQLVEAAIRLVGDSNSATAAALKASNVSFFVENSKPPANPGIETGAVAYSVPLNAPVVNQPGVYVGNDPVVISRMNLTPKDSAASK